MLKKGFYFEDSERQEAVESGWVLVKVETNRFFAK